VAEQVDSVFRRVLKATTYYGCVIEAQPGLLLIHGKRAGRKAAFCEFTERAARGKAACGKW